MEQAQEQKQPEPQTVQPETKEDITENIPAQPQIKGSPKEAKAGNSSIGDLVGPQSKYENSVKDMQNKHKMSL